MKNLVPTTIFSENGYRITQNRAIVDSRVVKNIVIDNGGTIEEFYESVSLYSYEEMLSYIKQAGFSILKEFGDYYGNSFNVETSPSLIMFGKK